QARRPAGAAVGEGRADPQSDCCQGARRQVPAHAARPRRRGDRMMQVKRRDLLTLLGTSAAPPCVFWLPAPARAHQPAMPVIGLLSGVPFGGTYAVPVDAIRRGLRDMGFVEGQNVAIEYRSAEGRVERLPALAADLVVRQVALIVA